MRCADVRICFSGFLMVCVFCCADSPLGLAPLRLSPPPPLSGEAFAERKQHLTRVSATVDELLNAIVGELI